MKPPVTIGTSRVSVPSADHGDGLSGSNSLLPGNSELSRVAKQNTDHSVGRPHQDRGSESPSGVTHRPPTTPAAGCVPAPSSRTWILPGAGTASGLTKSSRPPRARETPV